MSIDLTQFHQTYFEESFELLESMETALLEMSPGSVDMDVVNDVFRAAHSIKGGAGTFGFQEISDFTHVVEALLDGLRSEQLRVSAPMIEELLASVDCVRTMLEKQRSNEEILPSDWAAVHGRLEGLVDVPRSSGPTNADVAHATAESAPPERPEALDWKIDFRPYLDLLRTGNDPLRLVTELSEMGTLESHCELGELPDFDDLDPEEIHLRWELRLHAATTEAAIANVFDWVSDQCNLEITVLPSDAPVATKDGHRSTVAASPRDNAAPTQPTVDPGKPEGRRMTESQSIRVAIDKVDDLINMVGELVITQSMLQQIGENFDQTQLDALRDKLALLGRNTRELQESVMRIRMLPISFTFNRFPRLVHDLSRKLDKQVELELLGQQTELDKTVMEKISDPLTHLVRNALDHGIEQPEERERVGKPRTGTISMNAYHEGGNIVIEIADDGAGINKSRVLEQARQRGLVSPDEVLSDDDINHLIFHPGFSTAETVSDISGRGVGMDVVRKNIASIGGAIHLTSAEGEGSTVTIRLPLTLSILDGQTVRVGRENFILPLVSILESIQVRANDVSRIAGKTEVFKLRDEYLPVIRLHRIFDVEPGRLDLTEGLIVVVDNDRQRVGVFVDELLGQQQVVIKSLETNFKKVDGISGATILGDGTVALILDVPGLVTLHDRHGDRPDRAKSVERDTEVVAA